MIIDDTPANLKVLSELLKRHQYKVRPIPRASMALNAIEKKKPDLILLDINMPEMSGYEFCQVLKAKPELSAIPVIFISALDTPEDKVKAFDIGGVDYITKPFYIQEVVARVQTHLKIAALQQEVQLTNVYLANKVSELKTMEKLKDNLVNMIIHDLRSPLTGVMGYLSMLEMFEDQLPHKLKRYVSKSNQNSALLMDMINNLLDINKAETTVLKPQKKPEVIGSLLDKGIQALGSMADDFQIVQTGDRETEVPCDADLIRRVVTNLVGNACNHSAQHSEIRIHTRPQNGSLEICIQDQGSGIPADILPHIFDKFWSKDSEQKKHVSSGLGLTFCKIAIEAHGGRIWVESNPGEGSRFYFELPT